MSDKIAEFVRAVREYKNTTGYKGRTPKKGTPEYNAIMEIVNKSVKQGDVKKDIASETVEKTTKELPIKKKEIVKETIEGEVKPTRKRTMKVKSMPGVETAPKMEPAPETAKPDDVVVGVQMPVAHVIPLSRISASHFGVKLPFSV